MYISHFSPQRIIHHNGIIDFFRREIFIRLTSQIS